jgi:hypothetical protein
VHYSAIYLGNCVEYGDEAVGNLLEVLDVPEEALADLL